MAMEAVTMLRLHREIRELEKEPLEGIQYHSCDSNMRDMCLILTPQSGPFRGLRLHLKVHIPAGYPRAPPEVTIQTVVSHPNVFGANFICCDILEPRSEWDLMDGYNGGYTPAYLLKYIFYQLLSFFSVNEVDQYDGGSTLVVNRYFPWHSESGFLRRARDVVEAYKCEECGFNISIPSSIDLDMEVESAEERSPVERSHESCALRALNYDSWLLIFDHLSDQDMHSLSRAWPPVKQLQENLLIRRQLVCFYLRKTHTESVLGIGLKVTDDPRSGGGHQRQGWVGRAATVQMLDLLSEEAYTEHDVRTGVFGEDFDIFLPIAISPSHFHRAEATLQSSVVKVHHLWVRPEKIAPWPLCLVEVLPRLMNHMVLELVKNCDTQLQNAPGGRMQGPSLSRCQQWSVKKASEKALQGYCLLLDLFQKLAKRFPKVEGEIRRRVTLFRESQEGRHKTGTPDLGEFLTYLLVLKEDWGAYCVGFFEELLARNVVWYLDGRNGKRSLVHLAHLEDDSYVSLTRLQETFERSSQSLRLFMFQVSFLRLVSKGIHSHYGYPSAEDSSTIFQQTREIYAVKDWDDLFRICEYQLPVSARSNWRPYVCKMLKTAVRHSQAAKYHVMPYSQHQLYYWRQRAEYRCPAPSWWRFKDPERYALRHSPPAGLSFFPRK